MNRDLTGPAQRGPGEGRRLRAIWQSLRVLLLGLWLGLLLGAPVRAAHPVEPIAPLVLHGSADAAATWAASAVWFDPSGTASLDDVLARPDEFAPAGPLQSNLGKRVGAAWQRMTVQVPQGTGSRWVLEVDYPSLDLVDVYVLDGSRLERRIAMGDHLPLAQRPMPSRSHAAMLELPAGQTRTLLLRVQTTGSMVVPLSLLTPQDYPLAESREQALQGLIAGMGLCLLLYSLGQWVVLRDPMFGFYALTLLGTGAFFAALSGVGPQHVWGASDWLSRNGPPFFILIGVCGAFLFVQRALQVARSHPKTSWAMLACAALSGGTALVFVLGGIGYTSAQGIGMAMGPLPLVLLLPIAYQRLRSGDRAAAYVLAGWGVYSLGVLAIVGLLFGVLPVNFWTLHGFQFASLFEMAMWMMVLGERVQQMRRSAAALQGERDLLRSMAHTDLLTGLLNRRGLDEALQPLLSHGPAGGRLAVYLLDLDGFKAVNDTLGHAAGDELLVAVAQRLRSQLRAGDLVCRLGGDEFVLAVGALPDEAAAEHIGHKLLQAVAEPFVVAGQPCRVGLTVGYAIAHADGSSMNDLLRQADAAMYAGKQAGKHCVRRASGHVPPT